MVLHYGSIVFFTQFNRFNFKTVTNKQQTYMKSIFKFSALALIAILSFGAFGQVTPYNEFTESNTTIDHAVKHVEAGGSIWQITDNTVPTDIKTYIYYQRFSNIPNVPNPPIGWSAKEITYDQANDIYFDLSSPTVYIITEDAAVYIKIN